MKMKLVVVISVGALVVVGAVLALTLTLGGNAEATPVVTEAIAVISGDTIGGIIRFRDTGVVQVTGYIRGLSAGKHGFHVHEFGNISESCMAAGGHFNPLHKQHGDPKDENRHVGDLGNIVSPGDASNTSINIEDSVITLSRELSILGKTMVVHAGEDDLGKGGNEGSLIHGNAGARLGCGIIRKLPVESAEVQLKGPGVTGYVLFEQQTTDASVKVTGDIRGLTPGKHGFHIHEIGDTGDSCKAAGGHFNPYSKTHGAPEDAVRHVGDLGNIETPVAADPTGTVTPVQKTDSVIQLSGTSSILGRTLVVHSGEDDLGKGSNAGSLIHGNAGARVACGIVIPK